MSSSSLCQCSGFMLCFICSLFLQQSGEGVKSDDVRKVKLKETVSGIRAAEMRLPG